MFELNTIGELSIENERCFIHVANTYIRALKNVNQFSHIHVFYADNEENAIRMKSIVVSVKGISKQNVEIEVRNQICNGRYVLFDIKPFFPSEDCVKKSTIEKEEAFYIDIVQKNSDKFEIDPCGVIRMNGKEAYIQLQQVPKVNSSHIKVLWWFHKFDDKKYRSICECNPPYENAKRSGIFATRSPVRPNPIAMTICKVMKVDEINNRIYLSNIECFDKTPCIGLLPYKSDEDLILDATLPKWLSHWPKWVDEGTEDEPFLYQTGFVEDLLKKQQETNRINLDCKESVSQKSEIEDGITIKGAYENNLKHVSTKIPYNKITAVIGVSGSGKSSLVNDTVYAECVRRMEYLRNERNALCKPKIESMTGVIPAVLISQKQIRANALSTVGTYSTAYDYLRMIYAQVGVSHCPTCKQEIMPLSKERIIETIQGYKNVRIYDIENNEIRKGILNEKIEEALLRGQGALLANIQDKRYLFQTRKKCYRCDKIMFDISASTFSYIDQDSRCPVCKGYGAVLTPDINKIIEYPEKSILDGASSFWGKLRKFREHSNANWMKGEVLGLADKMKVDLEKSWNEYPDEFKRKVLYGSDKEIVTFTYYNERNNRSGTIERPVEGVIPILKRLSAEHENSDRLQKYFTVKPCGECNGERLNAVGRMVTLNKVRYPEAASMTFHQIAKFCTDISNTLSKEQYSLVESSINSLYKISECADLLGIGHLNLDRTTTCISGGEGQRLKLLSVMQSNMSGILYIFDEPSKGLHPKDYVAVISLMKHLRENGNTVLMVEHNQDMIHIADNLIEIGPGAGIYGGTLTGQGSLDEMLKNEKTQLFEYSKKEMFIKKDNKRFDKLLTCEHLCKNNLKDITVHFPMHALTCICGLSGSGKSTLMKQEIYEKYRKSSLFSEVVIVDQTEIGRSSRSILATYINIMDPIRMLFSNTEQAKELGYDDKVFSFNNEEGQCECCKGSGRIKNEFMIDSWVDCPSCKGKRYKKNVLRILYKEKNIDDILNLSVEEALNFFMEEVSIRKPLEMMKEVGLSYLKLGQSTLSFSGGEASRINLGRQLMEKNGVLYLLDEPTTGLHFSDVEHLTSLIQKLIHSGNTVVAIEHNKDFLKQADWLIELGPGAGDAGGYVIGDGANVAQSVPCHEN